MNNTLSKIIMFTAGAAIGSVVTWKLVKTKYEHIAQEEIDSVKEVFTSRKKACDNEENPDVFCEKYFGKPIEEVSTLELTTALKQKLATLGYSMESEEFEKDAEVETEEEDDDMDKPYVIPPEELGECDYKVVSLTCYADGVVTDEQEKVIKNIDKLIGEDSLDHFGEYEDDSVFVRNDRLKTDYEILKDYRKYSEIS